MNRSSYLKHLKSQMYEQKWKRFPVSRAARIIAVKPCLTETFVRRAEVSEISQGGATLSIHFDQDLPQHYYLQLVGLDHRIACAEIFRRKDFTEVAFIDVIPPHVLSRIVRADFHLGEKTTELNRSQAG